jgi:heme exporter protein A
MKSNSLTFEGLVIGRDDAALSYPITMQIASGEMLAVHGSNGSGKSTLLKTIAGLIPIHAGSIRIDGAWPSPHPILYLGHKRGLAPSMSVLDNVSFWAKAGGYTELVGAAMRYFDLADIPDAIVEGLSAGWQQRVALTRLITIPSPLWLLDEPITNLDAEGIGLLQSLLQSRLEQGGMAVIATHLQMQGNGIKTLTIKLLNEKPKVKS